MYILVQVKYTNCKKVNYGNMNVVMSYYIVDDCYVFRMFKNMMLILM